MARDCGTILADRFATMRAARCPASINSGRWCCGRRSAADLVRQPAAICPGRPVARAAGCRRRRALGVGGRPARPAGDRPRERRSCASAREERHSRPSARNDRRSRLPRGIDPGKRSRMSAPADWLHAPGGFRVLHRRGTEHPEHLGPIAGAARPIEPLLAVYAARNTDLAGGRRHRLPSPCGTDCQSVLPSGADGQSAAILAL